MADTTPLDKVEAVSICLSTIGEPRINSLEGAGLDAQMAAEVIDETSRKVQAKGWHWNKEIHKLSPDVFGNINLPANTVEVDSVNGSVSVDIVQRGLRLFDKTKATFSFTTPVELKLVVLLPFDDLPHAAKDYITVRAARVFQARVLGSETQEKFTEKDERDAWAELRKHELRTADFNMLRSSNSTASILDRRIYFRKIW